jgi:hypothetical protein
LLQLFRGGGGGGVQVHSSEAWSGREAGQAGVVGFGSLALLCFASLLGCLTSHGREYATRASVSVRCMVRWYNDDDDDDEQIWSGLWMEMMTYCYFYEGVTGELANNLVCVEVGGFRQSFRGCSDAGSFLCSLLIW